MKLQKTIARVAMLVIISISLVTCGGDDEPETQAKVMITLITPNTAFEGEAVTISGKNFRGVASENTVQFNGTPASVTSATGTQLQVTVPQGATSGKVTVQANGQTATSGGDFFVRKTNLTGFTPESGFKGTVVTINGDDFDTDPDANEVKFNGVIATVSSATESQLVVIVPGDATTGKITVTTHEKTLTSATDFTVLELIIASIEPAAATVGSNVVIKGANFSPEATGNVVKFGDLEAQIVDVSATEITVTVPLEAETGVISVTTSGNTVTSATEFTVLVPVIHDFSPLFGAAGTEITINGENFSGVVEENIVVFLSGDAPAEVLSASETQLVVMAPPDGFTGKIGIEIKGKESISEQSFEYRVPIITTAFPNPASPGITVTLTGENFSPVVEYNRVTLETVPVEVLSASATQLEVVIPAGVAGSGLKLWVSGAGGASFVNYQVCGDGIEVTPFDVHAVDVTNNGETFTLKFKILNAGNQSADLANVTAMAKVSEDDSSDPGDQDIPDTALSGSLAAGHIFDVSVDINLPPGISLNDYPYIIVTTAVSVAECYNGNNTVIGHYE